MDQPADILPESSRRDRPGGPERLRRGRVEAPWEENKGSSTFESVETDQAPGVLTSPFGTSFTSPFFLLFAALQGRKIASSEKSAIVTYGLP